MRKPLKAIYVRINEEDYELLASLFSATIGYNEAIRRIVADRCDILRAKMGENSVTKPAA